MTRPLHLDQRNSAAIHAEVDLALANLPATYGAGLDRFAVRREVAFAAIRWGQRVLLELADRDDDTQHDEPAQDEPEPHKGGNGVGNGHKLGSVDPGDAGAMLARGTAVDQCRCPCGCGRVL